MEKEEKACLVSLYDGKGIRMDCANGFSIGRIPMEYNKGLCLEDAIISREHACIVNEENSFYIIDLNSKNGTRLNGQVLQPYKKYQLSAYSIIEFSKLKYRFEYEKEDEKVDLDFGMLQVLEINGQKKCCIELKPNVDIIEYQKNMINHNPYHNLIKMSILSSDKGSRIYYNIENMRSLDTILREKILSKQELISLFFSIFEGVKQIEPLLLYPHCFVFHPKAIFYKENKQPCFIYVPTKRKGELLAQVKSLLMELTHKYLDKNEKEFKNQILMILAYEGVSLEDIKNIMIKARTVNALDSYDCNEEEELKEINKDKVMNLKKRILDNSMLCILVSQFILILILLGLKLIKGIQMNEWVGSCIIALALDAWFIKFVRKLNNANKTIICEKS